MHNNPQVPQTTLSAHPKVSAKTYFVNMPKIRFSKNEVSRNKDASSQVRLAAKICELGNVVQYLIEKKKKCVRAFDL